MKGRLNATLRRTTGYELRKPPSRRKRRRAGADRLVTAPAFVLSSVRSGSTLLRVLLDSHSQIHAPHELHLRHMTLKITGRYTEKSLEAIGLDRDHLRYLLWDRVLHRELEHSGKRVLVNKTPSDVFVADKLLECWPDAQFIFLLRHPLAIAQSRYKIRSNDDPERNVERILRYCRAVQAARETYPGLTIRYEDLTADPAGETQRLCEFLGVPWEAGMLDYSAVDHGRYRPGMGDWNEKLRSGRIQPAPPLPPESEVPESMREIAAAWGYLPRAADQQVFVPKA